MKIRRTKKEKAKEISGMSAFTGHGAGAAAHVCAGG